MLPTLQHNSIVCLYCSGIIGLCECTICVYIFFILHILYIVKVVLVLSRLLWCSKYATINCRCIPSGFCFGYFIELTLPERHHLFSHFKARHLPFLLVPVVLVLTLNSIHSSCSICPSYSRCFNHFSYPSYSTFVVLVLVTLDLLQFVPFNYHLQLHLF